MHRVRAWFRRLYLAPWRVERVTAGVDDLATREIESAQRMAAVLDRLASIEQHVRDTRALVGEGSVATTDQLAETRRRSGEESLLVREQVSESRRRFDEETGILREQLTDVSTRLAHLTAALDEVRTRLRLEPPDGRLDQLRAALDRVEHYQPLYGIAGLVDAPQRSSRDRADAIARYLGDPNGLRILDIGSSLGYFSFYLADRGAIATGWDNDASNVEVSRLVGGITGVPARFELRSFDADSVAAMRPGQYDVALLLSVLHHVIRFEGLATAQELVRGLLERVGLVILELAEKGEDDSLPWNDAQPDDPLEVLATIPDGASVTELGRFPHHLNASRTRAVLAVRAAHSLEVNGRSYPYDRKFASAYEGSLIPHAYPRGRRVFYLGREHFIKEYSYDSVEAEGFYPEIIRELAVLNEIGTDLPELAVPRVHDFEITSTRSRLVLNAIPGRLLSELAPVDAATVRHVARSLAGVLAGLGSLGLFHNDVRSWNVMVDGTRVTLIDFGLAARVAHHDDGRDLLWALHAAVTGAREGSAQEKNGLPPRAPLDSCGLGALYDAIASGDRDFARLTEFVPEGEH